MQTTEAVSTSASGAPLSGPIMAGTITLPDIYSQLAEAHTAALRGGVDLADAQSHLEEVTEEFRRLARKVNPRNEKEIAKLTNLDTLTQVLPLRIEQLETEKEAAEELRNNLVTQCANDALRVWGDVEFAVWETAARAVEPHLGGMQAARLATRNAASVVVTRGKKSEAQQVASISPVNKTAPALIALAQEGYEQRETAVKVLGGPIPSVAEMWGTH